MTAQVFLHRPRDFNPTVEASGVFCQYDGRVLFLKRHAEKIEGLKWGIPGGKVEPNEKPLEAALRELAEEAGIIANKDSLKTVASLYIRRPEVDFIFHMFFLPLQEMPLLQVAPDEHIEASWVNFQEGLKLPLISGGREALEYFFLWKNDQKETYIQ
ncbi:MAG: NUDIX hydrolase [Rhabdochlamydiaceae bacterium]|nr:NUDIX hydrolase [Rhabdochlamydiaceae bacterium]